MNVVEWKKDYLIRRYVKENFHLIPLAKESKRPIMKKWDEIRLTEKQALRYLDDGYNIGIVGGRQSRNDSGDLLILDFDGRIGGRISDNINKWRSLSTWVQFSPKGFHLLFRVSPEIEPDILQEKVKTYCKSNGLSMDKLHRTTWNPKHEDNTFGDGTSDKEHGTYFQSARFTSMYIVASPSKVTQEDGNIKSYYWLDDIKNGEILKL